MAQQEKQAIEGAREAVADLVGAADPSEVIFTSCATEANNAVLGTFTGNILISAIEHPSVRNPALNTGRCKEIPVDETGTIDAHAYAKLLAEKPQLVSIMSVNNEIGSVQDIDALGNLAREHGARFHSDITQGVGKCKLELSERPVDYATFSAHKFHGPKGVGAVWVRTGVPFRPFMVGGTHERFRRAGTLNVPLIVGLGEAARIIIEEGAEEAKKMRTQKERIIREVLSQIPDSRVNGQPMGAPHIISFSFFRTEGESVIINLDAQGVCCTAGSACSSGMKTTSHVLNAIGLPEEWLRGTVRVSLSRFTTDEEVDLLIRALAASVKSVRGVAGGVPA